METIKSYILEPDLPGVYFLHIHPSDKRLKRVKALACVNSLTQQIGDVHVISVSKRYNPADFEEAVAKIFADDEA
jgi:hypothetical protein